MDLNNKLFEKRSIRCFEYINGYYYYDEAHQRDANKNLIRFYHRCSCAFFFCSSSFSFFYFLHMNAFEIPLYFFYFLSFSSFSFKSIRTFCIDDHIRYVHFSSLDFDHIWRERFLSHTIAGILSAAPAAAPAESHSVSTSFCSFIKMRAGLNSESREALFCLTVADLQLIITAFILIKPYSNINFFRSFFFANI